MENEHAFLRPGNTLTVHLPSGATLTIDAGAGAETVCDGQTWQPLLTMSGDGWRADELDAGAARWAPALA
jgi:hypothetical protein